MSATQSTLEALRRKWLSGSADPEEERNRALRQEWGIGEYSTAVEFPVASATAQIGQLPEAQAHQAGPVQAPMQSPMQAPPFIPNPSSGSDPFAAWMPQALPVQAPPVIDRPSGFPATQAGAALGQPDAVQEITRPPFAPTAAQAAKAVLSAPASANRPPSIIDKLRGASDVATAQNPLAKLAAIAALTSKMNASEASLAASIGDVAATAGSAAKFAGQEELGRKLSGAGKVVQDVYGGLYPDVPFEGARSLNPFTETGRQYLQTKGVRALGFPIAMGPLAIGGGMAGAGLAGAAGMGALGTAAAASIGGALASRPLESAMEAGGVYEEALGRGMSEEEAKKAANTTFWQNNALVLMDIGELFTALVPIPGPLKKILGAVDLNTLSRAKKVAVGAAKVAATGVQELGEEGVQDVVQRKALGDPVRFDPQMQEAMALGGLMGVGLGGAGSFVNIGDRAQPNQPPGAEPQQAPAPVQPQPVAAEQGQTTQTTETPVTPTSAVDRAALIREANPGMDEGAIQNIVRTTAFLSDEEFSAFAQRVGKPEVDAAPTGTTKAKPLPPMQDNYLKPLSTYTDTLYRETSGDDALFMIPDEGSAIDTTTQELFFSNTPDLALGQGANAGILLEFDAGDIQGQVNTAKPTWEMTYQQGQAEFVGKLNKQETYQSGLRAITVRPDAKMDKTAKVRLTRTLADLEKNGWTKTANPDGSATYRRPGAAKAEAFPAETEEPAKETATREPTLEELETVGLIRKWGDKWQYRTRPQGPWYYANTEAGAMETATATYKSTPTDELLTPEQRFERANQKQFTEMDSNYSKYSLLQLKSMLDKARGVRGVGAEREFDGSGGRRTGAAVANQGARDAGEFSLRMNIYLQERIKRDLKEGKPVPEAALQDYPDLQTTKETSAADGDSRRAALVAARARLDKAEAPIQQAFTEAIENERPLREKEYKRLSELLATRAGKAQFAKALPKGKGADVFRELRDTFTSTSSLSTDLANMVLDRANSHLEWKEMLSPEYQAALDISRKAAYAKYRWDKAAEQLSSLDVGKLSKEELDAFVPDVPVTTATKETFKQTPSATLPPISAAETKTPMTMAELERRVRIKLKSDTAVNNFLKAPGGWRTLLTRPTDPTGRFWVAKKAEAAGKPFPQAVADLIMAQDSLIGQAKTKANLDALAKNTKDLEAAIKAVILAKGAPETADATKTKAEPTKAETPENAEAEALIESTRDKLTQAKSRNSAVASKALSALEANGVDVSEARDALDNYQSIERSDYSDAEEYSEARTEAWDGFIETLDGLEAPDVEAQDAELNAFTVQEDRLPDRITQSEQDAETLVDVPSEYVRTLPDDVDLPNRRYAEDLFNAARELATPARYKRLREALGRFVTSKPGTRIELADVGAVATASHELGHAIDYRLNGNKFPRSIKARFPGTRVSEKALRAELSTVSNLMRPAEGGPAKFTAYRKRHTELMADFWSLYLVDPNLARELAPAVAMEADRVLAADDNVGPIVADLHERRTQTEDLPDVSRIRPVGELKDPIPAEISDPTEAAKALVVRSERIYQLQVQEAGRRAQRWRKMLKEEQLEDVGAAVEGIGNLRTGKTAAEVEADLTPVQKGVLREYRFEQERARQNVNKFLEKIGEREYIQYIEDYLAHFYATTAKKRKKFVTRWMKNSPNAKSRTFPTLQEAVDAGFTPLTQNVSVLHQMWAQINWRVATNRRFVAELKNIKNADGLPVIMKPADAPEGWPVIDHPAVQQVYGQRGKDGKMVLWRGGAAIDPEVYQITRQVLEQPFTGNFVKTLEMFNAYAKKMALSLSMFHHWALSESAQATLAKGTNPLRGFLLVGGKGETLGTGLRLPFSDVRISRPHTAGMRLMDSPEFRRDAIQHGLQLDSISDAAVGHVQKGMRSLEARTAKIPGLGYLARKFRQANDAWDAALWNRFYTGLKAYSYYDLVGQEMARLPDGASAAEMRRVKEKVAELVNDMYGGQEWISKFWLSPKGRQIAHWTLLAPDWTYSNLSVAGKVVTQIKDPVTRRVLGRYWRNMLLFFVALVAGANKALTDRWPWENEPGHEWDIDVTSIMEKLPWHDPDDKRRRYIKPGKQFREVLRYGSDPIEIVGAKLSPAVQIVFEQMTGSQAGNGWDMPWVREDMSFYESLPARVVSVYDKFVPFSARGGNFAFTFPMSKGMGAWQAMRAYEDLFKAVVDPSLFNRLMPWEDARRLGEQLDESARRNGLDPESMRKQANTQVRGVYYGDMWKAIEKEDLKGADRIAKILIQMGVTSKTLQQSGERRDRPPEQIRQATDAYRRAR